MRSFEEWLKQNDPEFYDEGLRDLGRAGATALGLLAGSGLPPYNVAGAEAGQRERPVAVQRDAGNGSYAGQQQEPAGVSGKRAFNPRIGPQPRSRINSKTKERIEPNDLDVWKHQLRFVQEQERLMRFGNRVDPDYYVLVHYYKNQWPDPPVD